MKLIPLTGKHGIGKFVKVDDEDYEYLMERGWYGQMNKYGNVWGVSEIKGKKVQMHRLILGVTSSDIVVDHIDHDSLNNQRCNLREATVTENARNRRSKKGSTSRFLGVHKCTYNKYLKGRTPQIRYSADIRANGKPKFLGYFPYTPCGEILAALAYDEAAIKYHREFANLNFKSL